MTKSTPKKSTPEVKAPEPMDPSVTEAKTGTATTNNQRNAYALVTLASEVHSLYPEMSYEFTNHDGRNTALGLSFDLTELPEDERGDFTRLLWLVGSDPRVNEIVTEYDQLLILLVPSARTQDSRDSFGLVEAYSIMFEEEGSL